MIIYDFVDKEKDMEFNSKIKADPTKKTDCKKKYTSGILFSCPGSSVPDVGQSVIE